MLRSQIFGFVCLVSAGCGTSLSFVPFNAASKPPAAKLPEEVDVFAAGPPARPFTEIGMIEANQSSDFSEDEAADILRLMREDAAKRGCDGLVITGSADKVENDLFIDHVSTRKGYRGVCIEYTQPALPPVSDARAAIAP
jgi:hypothetical protein